MKVNYLLDQSAANLASWRMRAALIADPLRALGVDVTFNKEPVKGAVNVFMKHFHMDHYLDWIQMHGGVFDVTDPHFLSDQPDLSKYYKLMLQYADEVTCSSQALGALIELRERCECVPIGDAIEAKPRAHTWHGGKSILWIGHPKNIRTLKDVMMSNDWELEVVSGFDKSSREAKVRKTPWSLPSVERAMMRNDIVIVPGDPEEQRFMCVSANRVANPITAGKVVVAAPNTAYDGLSGGYISNVDMYQGVLDAQAMSDEDRKAMVLRGKSLCKRYFDTEKLAKKWLSVFSRAARKRGINPHG